VEWQHVASYYQNQINSVKYEGYDILNFRVGYQWKGVEVFSNILNLTDVLYATNATRGNNATDRTTYNAAAPRTFVFGIQYTFTGKKELL
jgi:outer membrane receptor protein involved in Fe transport